MRKLLIIMNIFIMLIYLPSYAANNISSDRKKPDEYYMNIALQLAKQNPKAPFAAVIVDNKTGTILAKGLNAYRINPTFHGEMVAINTCIKRHPHVKWSDTTLYTTAEPCSMCQSAIIWSGISRVVFATSIDYLKTHGWESIEISAQQVIQKAPFYKGTVTGGILADKTDVLFNR